MKKKEEEHPHGFQDIEKHMHLFNFLFENRNITPCRSLFNDLEQET